MPPSEDVFVVFGSASDSNCFNPLMQKLEGADIRTKLAILSAHKTPEELNIALKKTNASIFVAGAGVAAALPGVVASQTIKPVIGLPCKGAYNGLDSFLSIHQMPPGIPVIAVGIEETAAAARLVQAYLSGLKKIVLVEPTDESALAVFKKCSEFLKELKVPFETSNHIAAMDDVYIKFIDIYSDFKSEQNTVVISVPVKETSTEEDAVALFRKCRNCFLVG